MKIVWKEKYGPKDKPTEDELIEVLLKNRKVKNRELFLNPPGPSTINLESLGYQKKFAKIIPLLEHSFREHKKIIVYTDYDADGITGGTIMWETLHLLGFDVMPYVPHRRHEGYGFSKKGIDRIKKEFDPYLIISVDHGISGTKEIDYAASLGMKVIVTDHHIAPKNPPGKAEAVFHIPELSGSGVSYFFSKEVWLHFKKYVSDDKKKERLTRYFKTDYLALAAIGTVADLVPLIGVSRSVVYHGLASFPHVTRTGLKHIIKEAGIENRTITPYEIGFVIAPRINAVGRLEHAIDALRLLCTHNEKQAHDLASKVGSTNRNRKDLVDEALQEALSMTEKLSDKKGSPPLLIILAHSHWNEGIIGLIASKITEKYDRPTIVMTKSDGAWKGSARSLNDFHLTDFLRMFQSLLLSVGGHKLAAGFSVDDSKKEELIKKMAAKIKRLAKPNDFERKLEVDINAPLSMITLNLTKQLTLLAPYGIGNPYPTFFSKVTVLERKVLGKKSEHLKLLVKDAVTGSFPMECLAFYKAESYNHVQKGDTYSMVYQPEINVWNGKESVKGKIIYIDTS